ncbi:hypothetical protein FK178_06465 [Antarcticibacterium arcticum]|uniref:Uncharacterized protein n=1 Tax=Antarcticibacterium arcticum TaxID=2585771 RepID=A0A5B8YHS5_9FLAO|nr:hypothetical protein [Antarcticibacterium arcticum]QED37384.1 hypothetical protein FK178_06465 [Antarcticibacterium arcticum]
MTSRKSRAGYRLPVFFVFKGACEQGFDNRITSLWSVILSGVCLEKSPGRLAPSCLFLFPCALEAKLDDNRIASLRSVILNWG